MSDITWRNDTATLGELVPWERNPKRISKSHAKRLLDYWHRIGQFQTVAVGPGGEVYDGHQRLSVLLAAHGKGYSLDVRRASRALTEKERQELVIAAHVGTTGSFDWDELSGWDAEALQGWGMDAELLADWRTDLAGLDAMLGSEQEATDDAAVTPEQARQTLAERFVVPPFSVLDARQGYWQARKSAWIALGIQSELGRGGDIVPNGSERPPKHDGARLRHGRIVKGKRAADDGGAPLPLDRMANGKSPARTFGQDLMRGEHVVGEGAAKRVMPGGGDGANSMYYHRTADGYKQVKRDARRGESAPPSGEYEYPVDQLQEASGTSIFDPVLCEVAYTWFSPLTGAVLDPFAGGSVRGIVAACLGRKYTGIDLRPEQVQANEAQAAGIVPHNPPTWMVGDSQSAIPDGPFDFVFSCPPYYDLEIYSDDPADLSNMEYTAFLAAYRSIIAQAVARLADDRFACFVVGDVRDKKGIYRNFVSETIAAFQDAGAALYNEAILVTAVGSLPIRVGKQFSSGRKLGKTHQNVLVFVKGDPRKATATCGPVEVMDMDDGRKQ